jgi:hypothetical protein
MRDERAAEELAGPVFIFEFEIVPVISVMHIRRDQSALIGGRRSQRYTGETVLYFLSTDPVAKLSGGCDRAAAGFMLCNMQARVGSNAGAIRSGISR